MDGDRFDSLTRTLTAPLSRRVTLGGLAAGVLLSLGLALDESTVLAKKKNKGKGKDKKNNNKDKKNNKKKNCPPGRDRCGNRCCPPGQTCQGGQCLCSFGRPPCGSACCVLGETCVGGQCKHHCENGVQDAGESDTDCGRVCDGVLDASPFGRCGLRKGCEVNDDCRSANCREPQPGAGLQCVECLTDSECFPLRCLDNFCFPCAIDEDCPRPNIDAPEQRFCVVLTNFCPNNQPCVCRECRQNSDCPPETPRCQLGTGSPDFGFCLECLEDSHCPQGQLCNETQGTCEGFECDSNDDCASRPETPLCVSGSCKQCNRFDSGNTGCPRGQRCNVNGTCVEETPNQCSDETTFCRGGVETCNCISCQSPDSFFFVCNCCPNPPEGPCPPPSCP